MNNDNNTSIQKREIVTEMQESYLDYAMSVIVARALPDVRDGLKPIHRRILYAMHEMGLRSNAKFRKSATVVGNVLGKYHPHGDSAAYEAMVRLAQDFSMRYPLVHGQGNFGSIDGDRAAAHRYTEAKLMPIAEVLLSDIEKETVNFVDNFDGSTQEPQVLPTRIPVLLINGALGIAVGMATNIPPHNLTEVLDALIYLIDKPSAGVDELTEFVKGPDFPTGGTIYSEKDIKNTYATGKGPIVIRAKADIVESAKRGFQIVVTEIPYQVNKSDLIVKIATLVRDKKIIGIKDVRDESDREGLRIVVDLKGDTFPKKILNQLFKYTELQKTFHVNTLALVDGIQPQTLGLKQLLEHFIEHRRIVVRRRTEFDLAKALERAHILEGLKKALDHIDEIIKIIKKSPTKEEAATNLIKKFRFSDRQTTAILEMRLQTLAGLERKKIEDELAEKKKIIAYLEELLKSPKKILDIIKEELGEIKDKFGDERRTKVIKNAVAQIGDEELIPEEESLFMITYDGYIKRMPPTNLKAQKRGGKGLIGIATKEEDAVQHFFMANTHDDLMFFTDSGKVFQTKGYEVPESSRTSKGKSLVNFLNITQSDSVTAVIPVRKPKKGEETKDKYLFMVTSHGVIKKIGSDAFINVRKNGMLAIKLKDKDTLKWVKTTNGSDEIVLVTSDGSAIRFKESDVRPMGRGASGVIGIKLDKDAKVVGTDVFSSSIDSKTVRILAVMSNGYGKQTPISQYKVQKRGGKGILTAKITTKTGELVSAHIVGDDLHEEIIAVSRKGVVIRTELKTISILGRATQGVRIMKMGSGDTVASVVTV